MVVRNSLSLTLGSRNRKSSTQIECTSKCTAVPLDCMVEIIVSKKLKDSGPTRQKRIPATINSDKMLER